MSDDSPVDAAIRSALGRQGVPEELTSALLRSATEMVEHYSAAQLRPSELSGGDFVEACIRVCQFLGTGSYVPLGSSLGRFDRLMEKLEHTSMDDSLRIHIPRLLRVMYDVRNRRGVGHLPGQVSSNRSDAELLLTSARWVLAELVRLFHATSHEEAQRIVETIAARNLPVVQDFEGTLRVVTRARASVPQQILMLLLAAEPRQPTASDFERWTRAGRNQIHTALGRLDGRNEIHRYPDGRVGLTALGREKSELLLIDFR